MSRRPGYALALLLTLGMAATGCVRLPDSGPVLGAPGAERAEQEAPFDFAPAGPKPGASQVDIVKNFLVAMQATPLTTYAARQYLTSGSREAWVPDRGTVIYGSALQPNRKLGVVLRLEDTAELDPRGGWLGDPTNGKGLRYPLKLVKEQGEWRISNPPDRLLIPQSYFASRFQPYSLYFFDTSGSILVPEPVYLPTGAQTPTLLVDALLSGPGPGLEGVERSVLPARAELDDISVPVSRDGVADVPLTEDVLDLDAAQLRLVTAQLAWTLRQVPGVSRLRITVGGSPLELASTQSIEEGAGYDPAVTGASGTLYGLRDGAAVGVTDGEEFAIPGIFDPDTGVRSVGVSMTGALFAEVTAGGHKVMVSERVRAPGEDPRTGEVTKIYDGGESLLRPAWDLHGQVWLVDRTRAGAVITVVRDGKPRVVDAPGVSGERVRSFTLSRDGSRLVAEIRGASGDRLVVARVARGADGAVRRVTRAVPLPVRQLGLSDVRGLAWRSPTTLAVLAATSGGATQLATVSVDGSAPPTATTSPELFPGRAEGVAASPGEMSPVYLTDSKGQLYELAGTGRWVPVDVEPGFRSPTFVG